MGVLLLPLQNVSREWRHCRKTHRRKRKGVDRVSRTSTNWVISPRRPRRLLSLCVVAFLATCLTIFLPSQDLNTTVRPHSLLPSLASPLCVVSRETGPRS